MAEQTGFMAIQPVTPQGPYAHRKIVRGPDGTPRVILVDMNGNPVNDPSAYGIIESGNYMDPGTLPGSTTPPPGQTNENHQKDNTAKSVINNTVGRGEGGRSSGSEPGSGNFGRSASNNFGYVDKPGFMGLAGALPGPAGLIGKGVNLGINANNVAAVNSARNMLGIGGVGLGGAVKGTLKDNKGQVGDVTFGNSSYATPVGLEALSPSGMTNMTPHEANLRAQALGSIQVATPEQVAARDKAFEADFSKPGLISRMTTVATSFLDDMFGTPSTFNPAIHNEIVKANTGKNFNPTPSGFADMIGVGSGGRSSSSAPSYSPGVGKGATSTPGNPVSGASRSTAGKTGGGISPGASAAIGRGQGGLY